MGGVRGGSRERNSKKDTVRKRRRKRREETGAEKQTSVLLPSQDTDLRRGHVQHVGSP